jgi:hypothetical protein
METKSIYDFLHLLGLIKIRPNMDYGGDLAFHIRHNTFFSFFFFSQSGESSQAKTKVRGKKHIVASIHLFFHFVFQIKV